MRRKILIIISTLAVTLPAVLCLFAWITHYTWLSTGAYESNSFPMNRLAKQLTWITVISASCVAGLWSIVLLKRRTRSK